jgi:DNA-binding NtrC family response regulator
MATILIVDDLAANRDFLVTLLRYHGQRLLEAADGSQGLAAVQAELPDLVIDETCRGRGSSGSRRAAIHLGRTISVASTEPTMREISCASVSC